jgi:hypothetical protein
MHLRATLATILGLALAPLPAAEPWEPAYAALLHAYATPQGVRYAAWKQSPADLRALSALTRHIAASGPATPGPAGRLSHLINAYNIWTLHRVLELYPLASVQDAAPQFGFFSQDRITVAGQPMSLNHLEKELIFKAFPDPRIHFALNCASVSCPPLRAEPYTAARLEAQLDDATRSFLNHNPHALQPSPDGNHLMVSKIFEWYAADFKASGGPAAFINRHRTPPVGETRKLTYINYDWNLNEHPRRPDP